MTQTARTPDDAQPPESAAAGPTDAAGKPSATAVGVPGSGAGSSTLRSGPAVPRAAVVLVVAAAFVILVAGTRQVASIVAPAFFAFNLVLTTRPLQKWLLARHVPRPVVVVAVMLVLYAILIGVFGLLGVAIVSAAGEIPRYASQFLELFDQLVAWLEQRGINQTQLLNELQKNLDFGRIITFTQSLLGWVSSFSTQLGFIVLILFFLAIDTGDTRRRLTLLVGARPELTASLRTFATSVRRYWVVNTIFGLIVAVIDYVGLLVIGVPLAFTWGILAFVTNYIPNIGFVIGLVPPALVALLEGGVQDMVWVLVLYMCANTVIQTFIQPKFTSDAVGVNTTTTFLSLAFWSYVLGPLGALIAVPATLFVKAVLIDADPGSRWVNAFINAESTIGREIGPEADRAAGRTGGLDPAQAEHPDLVLPPPTPPPTPAQVAESGRGAHRASAPGKQEAQPRPGPPGPVTQGSGPPDPDASQRDANPRSDPESSDGK